MGLVGGIQGQLEALKVSEAMDLRCLGQLSSQTALPGPPGLGDNHRTIALIQIPTFPRWEGEGVPVLSLQNVLLSHLPDLLAPTFSLS